MYSLRIPLGELQVLISFTFPESPNCHVPSNPTLWETQLMPPPHPPPPAFPKESSTGCWTHSDLWSLLLPFIASWQKWKPAPLLSRGIALFPFFYDTSILFPHPCLLSLPGESSSVTMGRSRISAPSSLLPPLLTHMQNCFGGLNFYDHFYFRCDDSPGWPFLVCTTELISTRG